MTHLNITRSMIPVRVITIHRSSCSYSHNPIKSVMQFRLATWTKSDDLKYLSHVSHKRVWRHKSHLSRTPHEHVKWGIAACGPHDSRLGRERLGPLFSKRYDLESTFMPAHGIASPLELHEHQLNRHVQSPLEGNCFMQLHTTLWGLFGRSGIRRLAIPNRVFFFLEKIFINYRGVTSYIYLTYDYPGFLIYFSLSIY